MFMYTLYKETTTGAGYDFQPKTAGDYSFKFTEIGTYYLQVVAYDTTYDYVSAAKLTGAITVVGTGPRLDHITPSATSVQVGSVVQWTVYGETGEVGASGLTGTVSYEYSLYRASDDLIINTIRSSPVFAYTLTIPGNYNLRVRATDSVGTSAWIETGYLVSAYATPLVLSEVKVSTNLLTLGNSVTATAVVTGGYGALEYSWTVKKGTSTVKTGTTSEPTFTFKPTATGIYHFVCVVNDQASQSTGEITSVDVTVVAAEVFDITSITPSSTTGLTGKVISWTVKLTGGIGTKTVVYTISRNGSEILTSSITTSGSSVTVVYYPDTPGIYTIKAYAFDSEGTDTATKPFSCAIDIVVYDGSSLYLSDLVPSVSRLTKGGTVRWTFKFHNNVGGVLTTYTIYCDGNPVYTGKTTGKVIDYKIQEGKFGVYTISLSSVDVITKMTCSLSGGTVDYSYSGSLAVTATAVKTSLSAPGTAEWLLNVTGDPMGTLDITYTVSDGSNVVASGSTSALTISAYLAAAGTYTLTVVVTDATGRTATFTGAPVTVSGGSGTHMVITNLKPVTTEVRVGDKIVWTFGVSNATGTWSVNYKVMFTPAGSSTASAVKTASGVKTTSVEYTTTAEGTCYLMVQGTDDNGSTIWYTSDTVIIRAKINTALSVTVPTGTASCNVGDTITWSFSVLNPIGNYMVFYAIYRADKIMKMSSANDDSPILYVPNNPGLYSIKVYAMDSTGTKCTAKQSGNTDVTQAALPLDDLIISIPKVSHTYITSPTLVSWSFTVSSQMTDYHIRYKLYKFKGSSTVLMVDNTTTKNSFSIYLDETGNYYVTVQAIADDGSSLVSEIEQSEYVICNLPEELIEIVTPSLDPSFDPDAGIPEVPVIPEFDEE